MHKHLDCAAQVFSGWEVTAMGVGRSRHILRAAQGIGHSKPADPEQMKSASLNWPEESLSYPMLLIWKIDVLCSNLIFLLKCVDGMPTFGVLKQLYRT